MLAFYDISAGYSTISSSLKYDYELWCDKNKLGIAYNSIIHFLLYYFLNSTAFCKNGYFRLKNDISDFLFQK